MYILNSDSPRYENDIPHSCIELKPHQRAIVKCMLELETNTMLQIQACKDEVMREKNQLMQEKTQLSQLAQGFPPETARNQELTAKIEEITAQNQKVMQRLIDATRDTFGVLATSVGSGKTFCIIALCLLEKYANVTNKRVDPMRRDSVRGTFLVVPSHLYYQWVDAFDEYVEPGALKIKGFNDFNDITSLYTVPPKEDKPPETTKEKMDRIFDSDVYLVNSNAYELMASIFSSERIAIKRIVFDEINSMGKNMNLSVSAAFTWFVSASLRNEIQVNPAYKIPAYGYDAKQVLRRTIDAEDKFIFDSFDIPPYVIKRKTIPNHVLDFVKTECSDIVNDRALHALNAGDALEALRSLKSQGLTIPITGKNAKQTNDLCFVRTLRDHLETCISTLNGEIEDRDVLIKRLEEDRFLKPKEREEKLEQLSPGKRFKETLQRRDTFVDWLTRLSNALPSKVDDEAFTRPRPKIVHLFNLIESLRGAKVMIYSEFPRLFDMIENYAMEHDIGFVNFEGGNEKAVKIAMDRFKTDPKITLLGAHSLIFSCGTNLENLTHIIFAHRVSPEIRKQVIGRGQRPGRKEQLTVYELVHKNETV